MSEDLIFASETEAMQHLANLTGKRIKIAVVDTEKLGVEKETREWHISNEGPNSVWCEIDLRLSDDANEKELIKYLEEEMEDIILLFKKRFGGHSLQINPPKKIDTYSGGVKSMGYSVQIKDPSDFFGYSHNATKNLELFKKTLKRYGFEKDSSSADDYSIHDGIS